MDTLAHFHTSCRSHGAKSLRDLPEKEEKEPREKVEAGHSANGETLSNTA